jgi:hypothetical protein
MKDKFPLDELIELAEKRKSGVWSDYALIEIGTKLKELNQSWYDHLDKHFKN